MRFFVGFIQRMRVLMVFIMCVQMLMLNKGMSVVMIVVLGEV